MYLTKLVQVQVLAVAQDKFLYRLYYNTIDLLQHRQHLVSKIMEVTLQKFDLQLQLLCMN
jgi:ubiquinone biosynthesis protein UbiJ